MRYIAILSLVISLISGKFIVNKLRQLKIDQHILEIGPSWHMTKQGTPTMGGIIFLLGFVIGALPVCVVNHKFIPILLVTLGFGFIGFIDDFTKVSKKQNEGLTPKQKLIMQIIIVAIFAVYLYVSKIGLYTYIPFVNGPIHIGLLFIPMLFIIVLGTVNGVNLTDGLDGLAGTVTFIVATTFAFMSMARGEASIGIGIQCMCAGIIGFLYYNLYPARIFMGDVGSLALGGFVASCAYILQAPIFIAIIGIMYLIECLSVIIQVSYAKRHNGKRIFKMAPIHHHFEKCGMSENKIVMMFTLTTVVFCVIAYFLYVYSVRLK